MFLVVGELINATRTKVAEAIEERNGNLIRRLARRQHDAGADAIDLNAGHDAERELENLLWLLEVVEDEVGTDVFIAIDTSDATVMEKAIAVCSARPMMCATR